MQELDVHQEIDFSGENLGFRREHYCVNRL